MALQKEFTEKESMLKDVKELTPSKELLCVKILYLLSHYIFTF